MPSTNRGSWPMEPQHQDLMQPLPPYEPDPMMYPGSIPTVMYPGSAPTIPGLPYPPPEWSRFTWPIVPLPRQPLPHFSPTIKRGDAPRALSALMAFLSGKNQNSGGSSEPISAPMDSGTGCDCSKCGDR